MSERRLGPLVTLLSAACLFRIGNAAAVLALPWFVLSQTGSAAWAGVTAASSVVASIAGAWVGGGLVDRCGRAPVALVSGVVGGVATAGIPLLHALGALSPVALLACVVLGAAFDAPGMAAQDSHLPELGSLAGLSVARVTSLKAVMGHVAVLGGPALGGAAIGLFGPGLTLGLTAGCSILAGLLSAWVLPMHVVRSGLSTADRSMRAGSAFLWRDPLMRPLLCLVTLFVGLVGANGSVLLPALFLDAGRPASELGLYFSAMGAGGLAGISLHAAIGAQFPQQRWLAVAFGAFAAASALLSLLPGVPLLILLGTLVGMLTSPVSPILNTTIYERTPTALRGRVLGAQSAAMLSATPAVTLAAGVFVSNTGPKPGLMASAALAAAVALLTLRLRFGPAVVLDIPFHAGEAR